jgi:acetolactate synthase-1/2/3 large subunit
MSYVSGPRRPQSAYHGGMLLAELLAGCGVRHIFGLPGGQTMPLYDAIYRGTTGLRHVLMRDERNAAYAAVAYARATGGVGVFDATVGPGAALTTVALAEAHHSSTPLLALFSDIAHDWDNLSDFGAASQALDQLSMVRPFVKWSTRVNSLRTLPDLVRGALRRATSGRPGPVVLDLPEDVLRLDASGLSLEPLDPALSRYPRERSYPDPAAVERAARLLAEAERPLLVVGGGATLSGAYAGVAALRAAFGLPLAYTWTGKGLAPDDDPLNLGQLGPVGTRSAQTAAREADLIVLVGTKSSQNSTFGWTLPGPEQRVIHLDIDPAEIGRVFRTDVGLTADAEAGLQALAAARSQVAGNFEAGRAAWLERCEQLKALWLEEAESEAAAPREAVHPLRVVQGLESRIGQQDSLVCDASLASGWGGVYFRQRVTGRQVICPRGLAGLGFSLPAAIGTSIARPEGRTVCLAGDGAFAYTVGELASLRQHNLPVVAVVLNNSVLAWIRYSQRFDYDGSFQSSEFRPVDFARAAEGFGCRGITVERAEQVEAALDEAFATAGPVVVDVRSEAWASPILTHLDLERAERAAGLSHGAASPAAHGVAE